MHTRVIETLHNSPVEAPAQLYAAAAPGHVLRRTTTIPRTLRAIQPLLHAGAGGLTVSVVGQPIPPAALRVRSPLLLPFRVGLAVP